MIITVENIADFLKQRNFYPIFNVESVSINGVDIPETVKITLHIGYGTFTEEVERLEWYRGEIKNHLALFTALVNQHVEHPFLLVFSSGVINQLPKHWLYGAGKPDSSGS